MTKSKKITIILCSILFAFLGFFGIFLANKNDGIVNADSSSSESYMFQSSNLILPYSRFTSSDLNSATGTTYFLSVRFTFGLGSSYSSTSRGDYCYLSYSSSNGSGNYFFGELLRGNWRDFRVPYNGSYICLAIYLHSSFNYNVDRVVIENSGAFGKPFLNSTTLNYIDSNGNNLIVQNVFRNDNAFYNNYHYDDRTYWFVSTSDLTDNQYYNAGVEYGKGIGENTGYNKGYDAGYDRGFSEGDSSGYNRGVDSANDYTFLGLIGATIDAPITAFTSFFDFELLGVNLKDFFFAILTFALVIVIVRFALAR